MTLISPESRSVTRLGMTPASTTHWIFSLGPSVRYDRAQQASAKTCKRLHLYFRIIFYPQFKNVNKIHLGLTTGCQWRGIDYAPEHHLLDQRFLILLVCQKDNATEQTRIMPRNGSWFTHDKRFKCQTNLAVLVLYQLSQAGQTLLHNLEGWRGVFVPK